MIPEWRQEQKGGQHDTIMIFKKKKGGFFFLCFSFTSKRNKENIFNLQAPFLLGSLLSYVGVILCADLSSIHASCQPQRWNANQPSVVGIYWRGTKLRI